MGYFSSYGFSKFAPKKLKNFSLLHAKIKNCKNQKLKKFLTNVPDQCSRGVFCLKDPQKKVKS